MNQSTPRKGDWIQCFTGGRFYPLDPRPDEIDIRDIAHALSNQCRYGGQCRKFYSVAQHSVIVSYQVPRTLRRQALLHDAPEAWLVDLPRPVKYEPELQGYLEAEERTWQNVAAKFGLPAKLDLKVKEADDRVMAAEAYALMAPLDQDWSKWLKAGTGEGIFIDPWDPEVAEARFIARFAQLYLGNALATIGLERFYAIRPCDE